MNQDLDNKMAELPNWDRSELLAEWQRQFNRKVPKFISNAMLVRAIAQKWQEQEFGDISTFDQKLLDRMLHKFDSDPSNLKLESQIKIGTRLRRLWQGKIHEITAVKDGFTYDGIKYGSLSEIARLITGTRWNGKVFFGIKSSNKISKQLGAAS